MTRPGKIIQASTIDDLPQLQDKEPKIDFHAMIPISLYKSFNQASKDKGYHRNEILRLALEAFLNNKKV